MTQRTLKNSQNLWVFFCVLCVRLFPISASLN